MLTLLRRYSTPLTLITLSCSLLACGGGGSSQKSATTTDPTVIVEPPVTPPPVDPPEPSSDPLFSAQWHLLNTGQVGRNSSVATIGEDINVVPVWSCEDDSCRGEGVVTSVVDEPVELTHKDLRDNVLAGQSYDYSRATDVIQPSTSQYHGTAVAGILAARDQNGTGGRGVAPRSQLVSYGLGLTLVDEADVMTRGIGVVDISNNSWGPEDGTGQLKRSDSDWRNAVQSGTNNGRGGLGIVYTWAAGNGHNAGFGQLADNSNYDGMANNPHVIAVGSVNAQGVKSSYSELGANLLVSAPGGEFCSTLAIVTTDLSGNLGGNFAGKAGDLSDRDYTACMNATSSATPMVAGVAALMLQANPQLSWRDVRRVLASTARRNHAVDTNWSQNGAGYWFNPKYGFGVVDAEAAVDAARNWSVLPAQKISETALFSVGTLIPDNSLVGVANSATVSGTGITNIEFVKIEFSASDHDYAGDLLVELTSPAGTTSTLSVPHGCFEDDTLVGSCEPFNAWDFGSVQFMGEPADGEWRLRVADGRAGDVGTFQSWKLTFYGY